MRSITYLFSLSLLCSALFVTGAWSADSVGGPGRVEGKSNPLKNVYFAQQHLHPRKSPDAFAAGSRESLDDTFRYGRGEEVTLHTIASNNKIKQSNAL